MSNRLLNLVRDHSKAQGTPYTILRALADRIPDSRGSWSISYAGLAADCRMGVSTIRRGIKHLEAMGEISVRRWRSSALQSYPNEYRILLTGVGSEGAGVGSEGAGVGSEGAGVGSEGAGGYGQSERGVWSERAPNPTLPNGNQHNLPTDAGTLWSQALELLKTTVLPASFGMWLEGTEGVELQDNQLIVSCSGSMAVQQINRRLYFAVTKALYELTNCEWSVEFTHD